MEENQKSTDEPIEKLALITDALQDLFPDGKIICVFELKRKDFKKIQSNFRKIDSGFNKFSIDISGVDYVFINEEENFKNPNIEKIEKPISEPKKNFIQKVLSTFKRRRNSI